MACYVLLYHNEPHGVFGAESLNLGYWKKIVQTSKIQCEKQTPKYLEALRSPIEVTNKASQGTR